jgi:nucleotide-binding universal stress UspA family protein
MRIRSVVVGMDFSETSIAAARWAVEHFAPNADITLLHVIDVPDRPSFAEELLPATDTIESVARRSAERHMRSVIASISPRVGFEIRLGKPHEQIVEAARVRRADVIVVGPHDDRHARSRWLGATAEQIVRTSPIPVLVAVDPPPRPPRTLLVPVNESRLTGSILAWASRFAETFDAEVKLLHVWSESLYAYVASMAHAGTSDDLAAQRVVEQEIRDSTTHWLADLTEAGFRGRRAAAIVRHGQVADVTLDIAAATHADLIVMGKSGGLVIAPSPFGSTLRTLLHRAPCSVFVVAEPQAGL